METPKVDTMCVLLKCLILQFLTSLEIAYGKECEKWQANCQRWGSNSGPPDLKAFTRTAALWGIHTWLIGISIKCRRYDLTVIFSLFDTFSEIPKVDTMCMLLKCLILQFSTSLESSLRLRMWKMATIAISWQNEGLIYLSRTRRAT